MNNDYIVLEVFTRVDTSCQIFSATALILPPYSSAIAIVIIYSAIPGYLNSFDSSELRLSSLCPQPLIKLTLLCTDA